MYICINTPIYKLEPLPSFLPLYITLSSKKTFSKYTRMNIPLPLEYYERDKFIFQLDKNARRF